MAGCIDELGACEQQCAIDARDEIVNDIAGVEGNLSVVGTMMCRRLAEKMLYYRCGQTE